MEVRLTLCLLMFGIIGNVVGQPMMMPRVSFLYTKYYVCFPHSSFYRVCSFFSFVVVVFAVAVVFFFLVIITVIIIVVVVVIDVVIVVLSTIFFLKYPY